jgi:hypothetical protein
MALTKRMMAVGLPAQTALAINGQFQQYTALSTTSGQANATTLIGDINVITVALGGAGYAILPSDAVVGDTINVTNYSGQTVNIYPPVGGFVNNGAVNVAFALIAGSTVQLTCGSTALTWYQT